MNKKELVAALADKCGVTQAVSGEMVNAFCEVVTSELKDGNGVALPGFGQFIAKHRPSREMRNPSTGWKSWSLIWKAQKTAKSLLR